MHASSHNLAEVLANRLSAVIPGSCEVRSVGSDVFVDAWGVMIGGSSASSLVDDVDDRAVRERLEVAVRAVLSTVQDDISRFLSEPWPSTDGGQMAMPNARSDAEWVYLWFGDERLPVINMPAIRISDVATGSNQGTGER